MSRFYLLVALLAALIATVLVFSAAPSLDLTVAGRFYAGDGRFVGQTPLGEGVRRIVYWVPTALLLLFAVLYAVKRWQRRGGKAAGLAWAPTGRALLVLALSFALGPGLLVNSILKDHWHRPRPYQTVGLGGDETFQPIYSLAGACVRNCSFVSGEGAAAAWTVAPALLVPAPFMGPAIAAAVVFTAGVSLLRMAFGGHYLSDSILAVLLTWLVIWGVWGALLGRRSRSGLARRP